MVKEAENYIGVSGEEFLTEKPQKYDPQKEQALIAQMQAGSEEAFEEFVNTHTPYVQRKIYHMVRNSHDAMDLTQTTFMKAFENIGRFQYKGAPLASWLSRIAHNLAVSHIRTSRDHADVNDVELGNKLHSNGNGAMPESTFETKESLKEAERALEDLKPVQRYVIIRKNLNGAGYEELASELGKSVPAVRVIHHRGMNALRDALEQKRETA